MYSQSSWGKARTLSLLFFLSIFCLPGRAQVSYSGGTALLVVSGTSTLHDWTMKSSKAESTATFSFDAAGQISGVNTLSFSTPVNGLKSDHTAMDNNAYKALKTDKDPLISYMLGSVSIGPAGGGATTVTCTGKLTIAGSTRDAQVVAVCKPNADNTINVSGSEKISMKDFNIDPPTFMLGTIKTGNDITISFNLTLKRS
jgi:YceI-like domain